jgi:hypothetical protein
MPPWRVSRVVQELLHSVRWPSPPDSCRSIGDGQRTDRGAGHELIEIEPRGARHRARRFAPQPCIRLNPGTDPDHEAAMRFSGEAPRGGPIPPAASKPWPRSSHHPLGSLSAARHERAARAETLLSRSPFSSRARNEFAALGLVSLIRRPAAARRLAGSRRS